MANTKHLHSFLISVLDRSKCSNITPLLFYSLGKKPATLNRRLDGPQSHFGRFRDKRNKPLTLTGFGTRTVQFVVLSQCQDSSTDGTRKVVWLYEK